MLDQHTVVASVERLQKKVENSSKDIWGSRKKRSQRCSVMDMLADLDSLEVIALEESDLWVKQSSLVLVDFEGKPLKKLKSSFTRVTNLKYTESTNDFLMHHVRAIYLVDAPVKLARRVKDNIELYKFPFNDKETHSPDVAFLIEQSNRIFMVVTEENGLDLVSP
ncbi:MAG: hypothetical protein HRT88_05825 [Lentisphaeraceae bacterium]|nr:hypothetical protein [Lentisphaeraceae bacterium]